MAKSDRLAADSLRTKRRIAEVTEERLQSLRNCSTRLRSLPVSTIAVRIVDIQIYIYIYIYIAKSRIEHDHWPRSRSPLGNNLCTSHSVEVLVNHTCSQPVQAYLEGHLDGPDPREKAHYVGAVSTAKSITSSKESLGLLWPLLF